MDKQKALETALQQLEKQFGKGTVMRLGENAAMQVEAISTGSLSLDVALGIGGVPRGRIIEVYGPESSGKTTLALHVVASAQKQGGEAAFRRLETQALEALGKRSGCVIATGGGCVTRAENYPLLHQNSVIVWLQRDTARLPSKGRPLSQNADLAAMYAVRAPLYARFSDYSADNNGSPEETVRHIMEVLS